MGADDVVHVRAVLSGVCSDARSRPWPSNGRIWEVSLLLFGKYSAVSQFHMLVSLVPGCVEARGQAWPRRRLPEPRRHAEHYSLYPVSAVAACRRHPGCSTRDSWDHLPWHADVTAATAAGDVRSTSRIDTGDVTTSTSGRREVCLIHPCAVAAFTFLCQLRRHCRVHGQWLPDMPNPHTYGAASLRMSGYGFTPSAWTVTNLQLCIHAHFHYRVQV